MRSSKKNQALVVSQTKNLIFIYLPKNSIDQEKVWCSQLPKFDTVINTAWYADPQHYQSSYQNVESMNFALNLLEICKTQKVKHFIGIGSCLEYTASESLITKDMPLSPNNLYAASKIITYLALKKYFEETETNFTWARLFYLFGDKQPSTKLSGYLENSFKSKKQVILKNPFDILDFSHIDDIGVAISDLIEEPLRGPINICSGVGTSVYDLASYLAKQQALKADKFIKVNRNQSPIRRVVGVPDIQTPTYYDI